MTTKYVRKPLVETVLGIQFFPLERMKNAHLGLFWKQFASEWTDAVETAPLPLQFEQFGDESIQWPPQDILSRLAGTNHIRLQVRNPANNRMIQLQNGRLHLNWLGHEDGADYPSYAGVFPEFETRIAEVVGFTAAEGIGVPEFNQWEITYVNHILRGSTWMSSRDWPRLFRTGIPSVGEPFSADGLNCRLQFEIPPGRGRLHVDISNARRDRDRAELLLARITARGPLDGEASIADAFLVGHDAIQDCFKRVFSDEALGYWSE